MEGKAHDSVDMVILFVEAFIDRMTEYADEVLITDIQKPYLVIVNVLSF